MNNHGSILMWVVYRTQFPEVPNIAPGQVVYAARKWLITGHHVHHATDDVVLGKTLSEVRRQIGVAESAVRTVAPVNIGASVDDADNVVEQWVLPWGDDARVPQP